MDRRTQSSDQMATQMVADRANNKLYKAMADDHKIEMLANCIDEKIVALQTAFERGKANLNDLEEVKAVTNEYLIACKKSGTFPSIMGLSTALGYSRANIYLYMDNHKNDVVEYLKVVQTAFADILANASLFRNCDNATAIFLLKNSGQGLTDKVVVMPQANESPLGENVTTQAIADKYKDLIIDE